MVKSSPNTLVVFEEMGGDPSQISFAKRNVQSVCAHVSEFHPPPLETWNLKSSHQTASKSNPSLRLECPGLQHTISYIKFASFGTPLGSCGSFFHGECKSDNTLSIIQNVINLISFLIIINSIQSLKIFIVIVGVFYRLALAQEVAA